MGFKEKGERMPGSDKSSEAESPAPAREQDEVSGSDLGATGIFGPGSLRGIAGGQPDGGGAQEARSSGAAPLAPINSCQPPIEPVVHTVPVHGGSEDGSEDLLARLRKASTGWEQQKTEPAPGSGGFTELLRALPMEPKQNLRNENKPPAEPAPGQASTTLEGGFTKLLRALDSESSGAANQAKLAGSAQPEGPPKASAWPSPAPAQTPDGGFTELFKAMPPQMAAPGSPEFESRPAAMPHCAQPLAVQDNDPTSFTQLFQRAGKGKSEPPSQAPPPASTGADDFSFTRQPARQQYQQPLPAERPKQRPAENLNYGAVPGARDESPSVSGAARPIAASAPAPAASPAEGVGITRLMRMLDESPAPAQIPQSSAGMPPAHAGWAAPVAPPVQPAQPTPSAAADGPSEFTRIVNASKMREMETNRGPVAPAPQPPPMTAPPSAPPPNFGSAPGMAGGMNYMPAVQGQAGPASFSAGAGGVQGYMGTPSYQGMAPPLMQAQIPAMSTPVMPQPPAPKPAAPAAGVGKMQQYIPLLLILIIFLLAGLLITAIFLLKR